jgi:hypothetical protein
VIKVKFVNDIFYIRDKLTIQYLKKSKTIIVNTNNNKKAPCSRCDWENVTVTETGSIIALELWKKTIT